MKHELFRMDYSQVKERVAKEKAALRGLVPELSYGSHFFQDLVEAGTFYTALHQDEDDCEYHDEALNDLTECFTELVPEAKGTPMEGVIRVFRTEGHGAMLYAEVESQNCFLGWN